MKTSLKIVVIIIVVLTSLITYETYFPWEDKKRERVFHKRLETKIAAGETKILLNELTDFEWDQVCSTSVYWKHPDYLHYKNLLRETGKDKIDFFTPMKHAYESGIFFINNNRIFPVYSKYEGVYKELSRHDSYLPCSAMEDQNPVHIKIFKNKATNFIYWRIVQ